MGIETKFLELIKNLEREIRLADKRARQMFLGTIRDISNPTRELKIKYGSYESTSFGTGTNTKDTGEACGTIAFGGIFSFWPTTHWDYRLRGFLICNSSDQIRINIDVENNGADQGYDIGWFAVYY